MNAPLVNATRFRAEHAADWEKLESLVERLEKKSLRALSDDDLIELPRLYRTTLSSLSVARDTSLDRGLLAYLEQLSTRAYFQIYGVQTSPAKQVVHFFAVGWPEAVRALWRELLFCVALTTLAAFAAYFLIRGDPEWFYGIIPQGLAGGRDPSASASFLRSTLYDDGDGALGVFATFLFTHNSQVAIFSFALGFALAVPTILLIGYNGLMLGAFVAVFSAKGLGPNLAAWLMIHGTTEILAICIAGAAGIRIGLSLAFPGALTRMEAMLVAGRLAATAMLGTVVMLAVAGLLEGIGRQTITDDGLRMLIGSAALAGWLVYFFLPSRFRLGRR
ncbi:putative membrane protein SpoIIM required for sporulation [Sphingomonas kaistensis]|uniref:Putative membrane protein SpoIIM required for sporulation n=1 Tax=Sphingomonas kaistensis TaxID=298708 RepID=A0A7X5Y695_9SPHN|nr:putative membrane protein SpoIIM required for sporulation [Sphingomonas kaistensis]